jgi:hypothetical protein
MSVKNGLEMDFNTWAGLGRVPSASGGSKVSTVGGFLVLKPSVDLTLQSGQAPSLVGNFTLQFNIRVRNTFGFPIQPQIFVITANSGFFESIRGSSRIIKGVLSEQDIIAAPLAPAGTREGLARMIGGKVMSLANRLSMVKSGSEPSHDQRYRKPVEAAPGRMAALGPGVASERSGHPGVGLTSGRRSLASRLM